MLQNLQHKACHSLVGFLIEPFGALLQLCLLHTCRQLLYSTGPAAFYTAHCSQSYIKQYYWIEDRGCD